MKKKLNMRRILGHISMSLVSINTTCKIYMQMHELTSPKLITLC